MTSQHHATSSILSESNFIVKEGGGNPQSVQTLHPAIRQGSALISDKQSITSFLLQTFLFVFLLMKHKGNFTLRDPRQIRLGVFCRSLQYSYKNFEDVRQTKESELGTSQLSQRAQGSTQARVDLHECLLALKSVSFIYSKHHKTFKCSSTDQIIISMGF